MEIETRNGFTMEVEKFELRETSKFDKLVVLEVSKDTLKHIIEDLLDSSLKTGIEKRVFFTEKLGAFCFVIKQ